MSPQLSGCNMMSGRGSTLHGELTEAPAEGGSKVYYGASAWRRLPDLKSAYFLHLSLPPATRVGCQSPVFLPHPPIMPDMTDSQLGLPKNQIQHTPPCNCEKSSLLFTGTVTHTALSTASKPRLYSFSLATGFKLNRSKGTFLKKSFIFFNLFKSLDYSNFLFTSGKRHQCGKPPTLNKTFRPLAETGCDRLRLLGEEY